MPDLTHPDGFEKLMPDIEASKVVILDNLSSLYRSAEELSQNDWNYYNDCLDELRELNKAVLVLHHTDKDSRNYRGHSEIARAIDNVLIAVKDKKLSTDYKSVIKVRKPKCRHGANNEELMTFEFGDVVGNGDFQFKKIE
jgi:archaellum biogenesis ATPase FlaH